MAQPDRNMLQNPESLVLPFLDHEFQTVARIPNQIVADYCLFALIAAPRVIASPSFFAESAVTRSSILASAEFYGTEHINLSLRESSLESFFNKKQPSYAPWKKEAQYQGYYTVADQLIQKLRLPIRHRAVRIGESISALWRKNAKSESPFSFYHMTNVFSDTSLRKSVWQALATIPDNLNDAPFIWQNVCAILDKNEPRWRLPEFEPVLRSYLLICYFEALCEPQDAIVAFSDFQHIAVSDKSLSQPVIPLSPLRQFLTSALVMNALRNTSAVDMLGIINSNVCQEFRYRYFEILNATQESANITPNIDSLLGLSYAKAVKWGRIFSHWIAHILGQVGKEARRRRPEWSIQALLDDTVARGFVEYLKKAERPLFEKLRKDRDAWEREAFTSPKTAVNIHYNMGDTYNANNVGVMGSGAKGNIVNQSITQDLREINLSLLVEELSKLKLSMEGAASAPEHKASIEQIAQAEVEAKAGNRMKVSEHLKSAGKWALDQATKIGVDTATAAIKQALDLPPG